MTTPADHSQPEYPRRSTSSGAEPYAPPTGSGDAGARSASEAGRQVAGTAQDEAKSVASSAGEQVSHVADEARAQSRNLLDETVSEARSQSDEQMSRIGGKVRELASEMRQMVHNSQQHGPVTQFADEVSGRGERMADWLEHNGPDELLSSVRRYARRSPVGFLAAAAGAGLVAGRLARALQAGSPPDTSRRRGVSGASGHTRSTPGTVGEAYPTSAQPAAPSPYAPGAAGTDPYEAGAVGAGSVGAAAASTDPYASSAGASGSYEAGATGRFRTTGTDQARPGSAPRPDEMDQPEEGL